MDISDRRLAIIGLGYVGLPLAIEFGKIRPVMAFDINSKRVDELKLGHDKTLESSIDEIQESKLLYFTNTLSDLANCNIFIITVPTQIDSQKQPDFSLLIKASTMLAPLLKQDDI